MKKRGAGRLVPVAVLLAAVLIIMGIVFGVRVFVHFEEVIYRNESNEMLLRSVRTVAFYIVIFGGMVVTGVCVMVMVLLHTGIATVRFRKQAESLEQKNREIRNLAHHQRLETIGTLTSSIAHEFNNLLTPIMGYSMLALERLGPENEELYDDILEIFNASRKAKEIISRLNDLSRKNTDFTFRYASPDELVQKTLSVARPAKPENVELKLDLNCWDQRLLANEIQLSQLLLNLILNGFHAMEADGGVLTVATGYDENSVHLRVADTGCGIAEEVLPHIFEPFFTTKESGKGTGLGLAIAAQVVEDHGGTIRAESVPGEGTTFFVSLPRVRERTQK